MTARRSGRGPTGSLAAADEELVRLFDEVLEAATRRAGSLFGCHAGQTRCCRGPFPINLLDGERLRRGMATLEIRDPARAKAVRRRAARAVRRFAGDFPGELHSGLLNGDDAAESDFCGRHSGLKCPALDRATGRCDVYEWRPLACRSMGPPVRLAGTDLAPCPYCFGPASEAELERCRAEPDPEGRELALLDELEACLGLSGNTLIAFALVRNLWEAADRAKGPPE